MEWPIGLVKNLEAKRYYNMPTRLTLIGLHETEKTVCYYSNMLPLKDDDGKEYILLQYSDLFSEDARVNVMHRFLSIE